LQFTRISLCISVVVHYVLVVMRPNYCYVCCKQVADRRENIESIRKPALQIPQVCFLKNWSTQTLTPLK